MSELCSCGYPDCAVCACTKAERERDELREQVVRLEAERDRISDHMAWVGEEYYRLHAALEKYGQHDLTCKASLGTGNPCSCGLAEALQGKEPA